MGESAASEESRDRVEDLLRRFEMQMVIAVPPVNSPHTYAEFDIDLGNALQDVLGFVVHMGELLDGKPTNHLELRPKLAKTGGPTEALRLIHAARAHGLSLMLGCMVESSLGITAGAHLGPLFDTLDLDGHWLLAHDPFDGVGGGEGHLTLPDRPGLGVVPRQGG